MDKLKDYILVIKNCISKKLSDDILKEYKDSGEWINATIDDGKIIKNIRNCETIFLSSNSTIEKNFIKRKKIDNELFKCTNKIIKKYKKKFKNIHVDEDSGYELLKYDKFNFYSEHVDSFKKIPRSISCSLILNDDFKGGEFSFFNKKILYDLKKGSAIVFPSNFLYPHSILPVKKGTRFSIVTWFI
jgi:predicted 2-oxoglutarate/Fe(II)-dependent dioxygenase YbiX